MAKAFGGILAKTKNKQVLLPQDCEHPTGDTMFSDFQVHLPREHRFPEYISGLLSGVICFWPLDLIDVKINFQKINLTKIA